MRIERDTTAFMGACGDVVLKHYATNRQVAGSIPDGVIRIFQWHPSRRPGVDSASNRNEYQVYFLGVKAAGA
jgi:hypothetical protein